MVCIKTLDPNDASHGIPDTARESWLGYGAHDRPPIPLSGDTTAIAVAVDKLAVGLSFSALDAPLGTMVIIVGGQAFVATLLGLLLGKRLGTRAGDAAEIIAGLVFTGLGFVLLYKAFTSRG